MFGSEDELEVAAKGVDKNHPSVSLSRVQTESNTKAFHRDIDLLNADLSPSQVEWRVLTQRMTPGAFVI